MSKFPTYLSGLDVIGATDVSPSTKPDRALLIRVRDVAALVKAKGGAAGGFAQMLAPETIAATVYSKMRDEFASKMKEQGVDADVQIVSPAGFQPAGVNPIWKPVAITLGAGGVGYALWRIFRRKK